MMKYDFKNEAETATLKIYDVIGDDGWGEGITAKDIEEQINGIENKNLDIYINSNGGEVFEGFAIYNILNRFKGYKTVYIDGIAASIASVIAMVGNKVVMNTASMMMIHNASGFCYGNAEDMKKVVQALESINEVIRDVYKAKTNLDDEKLSELMDNETFMTAKECVEYGFADEINETEMNENESSNYQNSLKDLIASLDQRIKTFNDIKNLGFEDKPKGGGETVIEDGLFLNKSHWDWLRNGGIK